MRRGLFVTMEKLLRRSRGQQQERTLTLLGRFALSNFVASISVAFSDVKALNVSTSSFLFHVDRSRPERQAV
jgi:hypothetical protein